MRSEKREESAKLDRRRLLKGAGLVIGAASASTAVGATDAVTASHEAKPQQAGYRETEDVKTYYRLARF
jgi:hypothetical protein